MFRNLAIRIELLLTGLRQPSRAFFNVFVEDGCLLSYGPNVQMLFGNVSYYANRILKAEKPADLPVQQPTKFDLAVNLRTARALGLSVPEAFLALADRVIE